MIKNTVILIALGLVVPTGSALAHGVTLDISIEGRVVILSASYSPSQPIMEAAVSVNSPADPDHAWQTGRTDKTGRFAFLPDAEGEWSIVIDDQKGHIKRTTVAFATDGPEENEITDDTVTEPVEPAGYGMNTTHKIIIVLSLIIGITGFFYGLKAGQVRKKE